MVITPINGETLVTFVLRKHQSKCGFRFSVGLCLKSHDFVSTVNSRLANDDIWYSQRQIDSSQPKYNFFRALLFVKIN